MNLSEGFISNFSNHCRYAALVFILITMLIMTTRYTALPKGASLMLKNFRVTNQAETLLPNISDVFQSVPMTSDYDIDYTPENVALKLPACMDHKLAANVTTSKLSIQGNEKKVYHIGEYIFVSIKLYNGYGKPLKKGGAILRARMFNLAKKAFATASILDHRDGSYTAKFEALWVGNSTIKVQISYTPEMIRAIYYMRQKLPSTRNIEAIYSVGNHKEVKMCHPTLEGMRYWNYSKVCNLTGDNSGMPWYCGKPTNVHLLCEDWTGVNNHKPLPELPLTSCETILLESSGKYIDHSLDVHITGVMKNGMETIPLPKKLCKDFNLKTLWTRKEPTGFMYKDAWQLRHCKKPDPKELFTCLKNRSVLLFGDSTVRHWYTHVVESWNCTPSTEKWTKEKWHKRTACKNNEHNFTVQWLPHSQPFFGVDLNRYTTTSISRHLDETGNNEHVIALLHMQMHVIGYHHSVFRHKFRKICSSVKNLLKRNQFAKFLIKGPHSYIAATFGPTRLSDYMGLVFRHILYEEFTGLHDKVVFLDNSDIDNALAVRPNHPPMTVVAEMVNQMLAYVC